MTVRDQKAQASDFQLLRIAIIDDDPFVLRMVARVLHRHDVVTFARARDLRDRLIAGDRFDVIVSDLMMPHRTGADLHTELSLLMPEQAARMIVMTGGATTQAALGFLASEVVPVVEKPFEPAHLLAVVERVGRSRARVSGSVGRKSSSDD